MSRLKSQRELFEIPEEIAYFNCAYNSPQLKESARRLHAGVNTKNYPWERTPADFFTDAEQIRKLSQELFGGQANGYAVVPSASYGISTAARILETTLTAEDAILLLEEEFPSIVLSMQRLAKETGAEIVSVATPKDGNWTKAIENALQNNIKVIAISSCHWTNGAYIDMLKIRKLCDKAKATLIIDATQTLGAVPFSVDEVKPDFMVAAGYKWLLCPYGFSIMYVAEKWHNQRPLEETWIAREKADDFANLVNYSENYMEGARRFDVGEKCTPTILPGAIAALEQIKTWGVQQIAGTLSEINQQIAGPLTRLGFQMPPESQRYPNILGAKIPENYSGNIVNSLKEKKIYISQRGKSLRFAPHLYIDDKDINRLINAITELVTK